jgi:hypothetical protein
LLLSNETCKYFLNQAVSCRAKEERLKDKKEGGILDGNDGASEILSWVGKSRKLDEKRQAEKEKALRLARALEEQVIIANCFWIYCHKLCVLH